ncbi:glycosyltransferase family 2 protein [Variovorax sp. dw_308]|uniref:glycosyltransferase family 2 protein n=1 Tax=Variovorax sp. dw_308 TaxID=2721546 RepID=UPI001C483C92|nr:glycosyltransferase [Variovorax sp. dw_308]
MLISILVPTFRRPHHLAEALESLAQQDRSLIGEIIVGDDSPVEFRAGNRATIAASGLEPLVRHVINDPPLGNYPNQCALGSAARFDHILILHDDDHLCPGALATLAQACAKETDERVKIWFGRNEIMDEKGRVDPVRTATNHRDYGKEGPGAVKTVREWSLQHAIPPNSFLMPRTTYLAHMFGARDGNIGDWGLSIRLANSGAYGRFIAQDLARYRVHAESLTNSGRGVDAHLMYELAQQLKVSSPEQIEGRKRLLRQFAVVATTRYLRDGERAAAWKCFLSPDWQWKRRLSPRGVVTLGMLMTPAFAWQWAMGYRGPGIAQVPVGPGRPAMAVAQPSFGVAGFAGHDEVDDRSPRT